MESVIRGTTALHCPALPQRLLRGLHSPAFRHNLASVAELQRQGVEVTFPAFKNSAECKDPTTGTVLWTFHRRASGLYEAEVRETAAALHPSSAAANSAPPIHPTTILHQRLGHMGVGSMRTVISAQSIKGLPATFVAPPRPFATDCLPCIQGKTQAAPHPLVLKRATRRGEKLHVDLVGPMPTSSIRGHRYCLTIVECFSRKKFTILLHTKAQARTKIIEFINMVECKTKLKVEHLHGDRGREFFNDALLSYLVVREGLLPCPSRKARFGAIRNNCFVTGSQACRLLMSLPILAVMSH